jgi:hypothetical protein
VPRARKVKWGLPDRWDRRDLPELRVHRDRKGLLERRGPPVQLVQPVPLGLQGLWDLRG